MTAMCDMILSFQFLLDFELLMMMENRRSFKCAKTKRESQKSSNQFLLNSFEVKSLKVSLEVFRKNIILAGKTLTPANYSGLGT